MSDDPLLSCTADIDDEVLAAIRDAWSAERVDIEGARASQAHAEAEFEQRVNDRPELIERLAAGDFDVLEAMLEEWDDTPARPHKERFAAANQRLLRERPDLIQKLAMRYRGVLSRDLPENACFGLWMFKHSERIDPGSPPFLAGRHR